MSLEIFEILVLALGIYLVITFAVETVHVIGLSMYPTLNDNNYLVASKMDYRLRAPQRGDIVILRSPFSPQDLIKRVVGLPGERLQITRGVVYINGRRLVEPYISPEPWVVNANWPGSDSPNGQLIPDNSYFVMGDNRNHSSDSRAFGPVARDQIEARAWFRIWPMGTAGGFGGGSPRFGPVALAPSQVGPTALASPGFGPVDRSPGEPRVFRGTSPAAASASRTAPGAPAGAPAGTVAPASVRLRSPSRSPSWT